MPSKHLPRKLQRVAEAIRRAESRIIERAYKIENEDSVFFTSLNVVVQERALVVAGAKPDPFDQELRQRRISEFERYAREQTFDWFALYRVEAYALRLRWINSAVHRRSYVWPAAVLPKNAHPYSFPGLAIEGDVELAYAPDMTELQTRDDYFQRILDNEEKT